MAERRMFAKTIVLSDAFLDMPPTARCLYFTLNMLADDDGFVNNPKSIMRQSGSTEDDMKLLIAKKFLIPFESGVVVIRHWRINNYLRSDRYSETQFSEEKSELLIDEKGVYNEPDSVYGIPTGIPTGRQAVSTGKDSIGKDSIDNNYIDTNVSICEKPNGFHADIERIVAEWNSLAAIGIPSVSKMSTSSQRYKWTVARLKEYGVDDIIKAIDNVKKSSFLRSGSFNFTYDWFIRPNNFIKVLDGNYLDKEYKEAKQKTERKGDWE